MTSENEKLAVEIKKALSGHKIIKRQVTEDKSAGYFLLMGEDKSNLWYQITYAPNLIILSGDMGEMVIVDKPFSWLKNALISNVEYFLSKTSSEIRSSLTEFSKKEASLWLDELEKEENERAAFEGDDEEAVSEEKTERLENISEARDTLEEIFAESHNPGIFGEQLFLEATELLWSGNDVPNLRELTSWTEYRLGGFRRFLEIIDEDESEEKL